jgi:hypothetical protein
MTFPRMTRSALATLTLALAATAAAAPAQAQESDPRIGLRAGLHDAEQAIHNLRLLSATPSPAPFSEGVNSDLAFLGNLVIQGNYLGVQFWDIADPRTPAFVNGIVCPASQSDVSVYGNLLFVSGEGLEGRLDCGTQGVQSAVSPERLRGIRIFDISDVENPRYLANVQTCRGSHTHTLHEAPHDPAHIYIYVSGSAPVRPAAELPGCSDRHPDDDPASARFRIEVIRVPLAHPEQAAIVTSPRIFTGLDAPPTHGLAPADQQMADRARAQGLFVVEAFGEAIVLPPHFTGPLLDSIVAARGGSGPATAADSATLRRELPAIFSALIGMPLDGGGEGPDQCHDITIYAARGLAGGACEGYGLLLDASDPSNPRRLAAVADSNFAYWHSATFNNAGTKVLFTDEWGGGGGAKCRASDPPEWGANAIFSIDDGELRFRSYWKLPVPQSDTENCVAHNGSMIPVPGRDIMVQAWYQGGITVFDWTDPENIVEIAFFDRGPVSTRELVMAGSWSVYWYNGLIVSSEIARGLDILELLPSEHLSQNEIDAAKSVQWTYHNAQSPEPFVWPPSFALARAYLDQLERGAGLDAARIAAARAALEAAESASGAARTDALQRLAAQIDGDAAGAGDATRVTALAAAVRDLAAQN